MDEILRGHLVQPAVYRKKTFKSEFIYSQIVLSACYMLDMVLGYES